MLRNVAISSIKWKKVTLVLYRFMCVFLCWSQSYKSVQLASSLVINPFRNRVAVTQIIKPFGTGCYYFAARKGWRLRYRNTHCALSTMKTILQYQPNISSDNTRETDATLIESTEVKKVYVKTNRELAEERLQVYRSKREARQKSIESSNEKNYHLKELLHGTSSATNSDSIQTRALDVPSQPASINDTTSNEIVSKPSLYQVKILVAESLRQELKLSGREKRGRVFIPMTSNATYNMMALRAEMHAFFRALKKDSYVLFGGYPMLSEDGTIIASISNVSKGIDASSSNYDMQEWPILCDEDVQLTFQRANDWYEAQMASSSVIQLKRPSIVIHVRKNPNMLPPPPPPAYLMNMSDPTESTHMSMLSFYSFPADGIDDPNEYSVTLRKLWKPFQALGRIYIAHEGINAQMSVPTNVLSNFQECCNALPNGVGAYLVQNGGINIDPIPLTREEFAVAGIQAAATVPFTNTSDQSNESTADTPTVPTPPFSNLHIRVRQQIVADGFDKSYDWQQAGYDMPALEWHEKLKEEMERRRNGGDTDSPSIRLLDCRNIYETDVGRFEGSEPLETHTFRDSWDALKQRLADTPKDAPIMTYCTGGIRCVKVGAYLTQELGFTNVSRLAGGIIAYDRILNEKAPEEKPLFKGTNFVFDGRLGRPITEDSLGSCITCGSETSAVSNCRNENCHKRIVQCENCRTSFSGTCSDACRHRIINGAMRYRRNSMGDSSSASFESKSNNKDEMPQPTFKTLDEYSRGHSSPLPSVYPEIELNTRALIPSGAHMVSGTAQGKLLTQFASMTREGRILELGTFTGYGTTCLLEGSWLAGRAMQNKNAIGGRESGPYVLTMERDAKAYDVAVSQLTIIAELGITESAAESLCALRSSNRLITNVSDTASVSLVYDSITTCELLKVSDGLATVEAMCDGRGDLQPAPFDLVFLDADKTRLLEYAEALLSSDRVLKPGGIIVVDNVLWKGLVLEASNGNFSSLQESADTEDEVLRRNRRARKLASKMHRFNSEIVKDNRVDVLVLPLRDGLSVVRKK